MSQLENLKEIRPLGENIDSCIKYDSSNGIAASQDVVHEQINTTSIMELTSIQHVTKLGACKDF